MTQPTASIDGVKLEACPFCGGEMQRRDGQCVGDPDCIVHKPKEGRTNCGLSFSDFNASGDVSELWNARATLTDQPTAEVTDAMIEAGKRVAGPGHRYTPLAAIYLAMLTTSPRQDRGGGK